MVVTWSANITWIAIHFRWEEVAKHLKLDVNIQELGDNGEYAPIEIAPKPDVSSIGVFQLKQVRINCHFSLDIKLSFLDFISNRFIWRSFVIILFSTQGQSRRIEVRISPVQNSGTLPLICEGIAAVYAGSVTCSSDKNRFVLNRLQFSWFQVWSS